MRSFKIPDQYSVDLAQTLLRGPVLYHWNFQEEWLGHERSWPIFVDNLDARFRLIDDMTIWNR